MRDRGYFPTHRTEDGIDPGCQAHAIITAANDYCVLIDHDWDRIADWYRLDRERSSSIREEQIYDDLRQSGKERAIEQWPPWRQLHIIRYSHDPAPDS